MPANKILLKLKQLCLEHKVPIMRDKTLQVLTKLAKNKKILEIGSGFGYSSLSIWTNGQPKTITTLEKDKRCFEICKTYLKDTNITIHNTSAFDWFPTKQDKYDLLILDGPKSNQKTLFQKYLPFLNSDGYIFIDNTNLFSEIHQPTLRQKKLKQKVNDFKEFLKHLNPEKFQISFFDIEDGYCIIKLIK